MTAKDNTGTKRPLIILTGPTAVGKTALSIGLAKAIQGEIISADSMQVYRGMDIGTAKITKEQMDGVPHHLIDIMDPSDSFHVMAFQQKCKEAMEDIYARHKIPILVGGTGFYIQSVLYDISFTETDTDIEYRQELQKIAEEQGGYVLHARLAKIDPEAADEIHPNNVKRVIRALEFYEKNHYPISEHNETQQHRESPYEFRYFVLNDEREKLYQKIELRVDEMVQNGLLDEVKHLKEMGYHRGMVSMQGLGYKEILDYLDGVTSLDEALYILKRDTRHFAKRQITWFKREKEVIWVDKNEFTSEDTIMDFMLEHLRSKGIIS